MPRRISLFGLSVAVVMLPGCFGPGDEVELTQTEERSSTRPPIRVNTDSEERFAPALPARQAGAQRDLAADLDWRWEVPEGWKELEPTSMRQGNLRFGPNSEGECVLSVLPNAGGGPIRNANRWREQMNLEPLSQSEFDALPRRAVLGREAVMIDFEGAYQGMGAQTAEPGYRMLGAIFELEGLGVFVKMVGPAEVVTANEGKFEQWLDSLRVERGSMAPAAGAQSATAGADVATSEDEPEASAPPLPDDGQAQGQLPPDHPPIGGAQGESQGENSGQGQLPPDHPPLNGADPSSQATDEEFESTQGTVTKGDDGRASAQGYSWLAPEGWESEQKPMRLVSYRLGEGGAVECYITVLPSRAGGMAANLNRWRGQMGKEPVSEAELNALPKVSVLGKEAPILEVSGTYTSMRGDSKPNQTMVATAVIGENESVFVRMTGPSDAVAQHKETFLRFCESIKKD